MRLKMSNFSDWDYNDYEPLFPHYRYHESDAVDAFAAACKEFGERAYRNMSRKVTCFECEHYRQDTDDGVICPRCNKGRSVIITNGEKKRHCLDFDEIETEEKS